MSEKQQALSVIFSSIMFGCLILAYFLPEGLLTEASLQVSVFMFIMMSIIGPYRDEKTRKKLFAGIPFWVGVFFWGFGYPYGGNLLIIGLILTGVLSWLW